VPLAAPTTPHDRVRRLVASQSVFRYVTTRSGTTSARGSMPGEVKSPVNSANLGDRLPHCPIAAGFGISTPGHVASLRRSSDAAVVGSALLDCVG